MCDDAVDNYDHAFSLFHECSKTQKMCDNAVNTSSTIQFVPECYKTQEVCDKAVDTYPFVFILFPD